jgi:superfamily I DNA/RNA helicase
MQTLSDHAKSNLSASQLKIFEQIQFSPGLSVAEAAAGAGKTRTLSYLILKALLDDDVKEVFVLTATRTAKDEALARVNKLHCTLGFDRNGQCPFLPARNVRTIHSICLGAARDEAAEEQSEGVGVVSGSQIKDTLSAILKELRDQVKATVAQKDDEETDFSSEFIDIYDTKTDEMATLLKNVRSERLHSCVPVVDDSFGSMAHEALAELERRMAQDPDTGMQLMDFDAMTERYRASGRPIVHPGDVLFVDEAQDLTRCQIGILVNTLNAGGTVVCLGDDSQGIFQFSGACDQTLRSLKEQARSAEIPVARFGLMQNHRSTENIVKVSEVLLPFEDRTNRVGVCGNGTVGDPVEVGIFTSDLEEAESISKRVIDMVLSGAYVSSDIVLLRHRNWAWNDVLPQTLRRLASEQNIEVPMAIAGQDATNSLQGKFLCVLQVSLDLERFCDVATEGLDILKGFLKCMRGHKGWNQKIGLRAIETVFQRHASQDPVAVFTRYREEVLAEFRAEEAKDDAQQAEKDAKKGVAKRKRVVMDGGPTIKERNFDSVLRIAGKVVLGVRDRVKGIELGRKTLEPMVVSNGTEFFARDRNKPPESTYPTLQHTLGGLAWLILRDVVAHEYTDRDAFDIQQIVSNFDVNFEESLGADVVEALLDPVANLSSSVHDKTTAGKLLLSTIHKYKGLENRVAFVSSLTEPWASPTWPRRATLAHEHSQGCKNRSGHKTNCCAPFRAGMQRLKNAQISEKRRLYYVGASRAKERLFLSAHIVPEIGNRSVFSPLMQMVPLTKNEWRQV